MKSIKWFREAQDDLNDIYEFYFIKNPTAAIHIHNSLLDEIERLQTHSEIAAVEPLTENKGYRYTFRSLVTKNGLFKVVYFVDKDTVAITRIWSCRKDTKQFPL
ncbi:type II toxin-antitoxin system RelE/ParE family toxin [Bacteroides sp. OttesenSCG-928-F21]|nr:type II toxin-antitoxin system RelE/ParE family toxin [Bacteroides sp. OttesenSCG-928-F21]